MTEEIIIDGVNVAGCEYMLNNKIKGKQHCPAKAMPYAKETSCICRKSIDTPYNFCKHNPNCHYKQLKRLEQERDELKFENDRYKQLLKGCPTEDEDCGLCVIDEQNKRLKQENKELKEKKDKYYQQTLDDEILMNELSLEVDLRKKSLIFT